MKTDDLNKGNKIQERIDQVNEDIETLKSIKREGDTRHYGEKINCITISMAGQNSYLTVKEKELIYTDKANVLLPALNQLYRDQVLRTLEKCKEELEKEFEMI